MSSSFSILVTGGPYSSQAHISAQHFISAIIEQNHLIKCVFFYGDGVLVANHLMHPANDEYHMHLKWRELALTHQLELHACVSVASKRGVLDEQESKLAAKNNFNVTKPFVLSGLGTWAEAVLTSDRSIHFS